MGEEIRLGAKGKDVVTGFVGTVTAKAEYLGSPGQIRLEAMVDGKPVEMWVSEERVQVVE